VGEFKIIFRKNEQGDQLF